MSFLPGEIFRKNGSRYMSNVLQKCDQSVGTAGLSRVGSSAAALLGRTIICHKVENNFCMSLKKHHS